MDATHRWTWILTPLPLVLLATGLAQAASGPGAASWPHRASAGEAPDGASATRSDEHGRRARAYADLGPHRDGGTGTIEVVGPAMWSGLGPFGGDVEDVASSPVDPNLVLAGLAPSSGGGGALFRSTNAGATWTEVGSLSGVSIYDIEFDPAGVAYIGTIDSVRRSIDGGLTWTQSNLGIGLNDQVFEVTVDPNDPTRIWIGVADALGNQPVNVMLSTNSGTTWTDMTPPLGSPMTCAGIALNPGNSSEVYACFLGGFGGGAVWVSTNGGTTWTDRSAGLPGNPMNDIVHDGTRALLGGGQLFGSQFVGLYSTTNLGVTWNALHDGTWPLLVITDVEVDPSNANNVFAASDGQGVYRSTDGGTSWTFGAGGTGSLAVREVHVDPSNPSVVYTGSASNAVWKSADGGTSFGPSSVGIGALNVVSVAADPNDADRLMVAFEGLNNGGVLLSTDAGVNWTLQAVPATRWSHVRFAPDGTPYAISSGPTTIAPEGLYRRVGGVWSSIGPNQGPVFESELYTIRFSVNDPLLILSSGNDFGVAGFEPTIWRSTNGGSMWTKVFEGVNADEEVRDLEIVEDGTDTTMVACYSDFGGPQTGGALRSTNGGATWVDSSTGLAAGAQGSSLCPSPADPMTFYFADDDFGAGGLWVTTNAGQTWANTGYTTRALRVERDPARANVLYVAQFNSPWVLVSEDSGATFSPFSSGLSAIGFARDLFYAPGSVDHLLLATTTGAYSTPRCADVASYCTGKTNSLGCVPFMTYSGVASETSTGPFRIEANDVLPTQVGLLLYSAQKTSLNFHGGTLCVKAPFKRLLPPKTPSTTGPPPCTGVLIRNFNNTIQSGNDPILTAGQTIFAQWRQRDPSDPAGFGDGLSNGLRFTICP
jgi:hypothetical protein